LFSLRPTWDDSAAFPFAFAKLSIALFLPLTLALPGIVLRGAAFIFRTYAVHAGMFTRVWGRVFSSTSTITPFLFGTAAAAVASGRIRVQEKYHLARILIVLGTAGLPGAWGISQLPYLIPPDVTVERAAGFPVMIKAEDIPIVALCSTHRKQSCSCERVWCRGTIHAPEFLFGGILLFWRLLRRVFSVPISLLFEQLNE